MKRAYFACLALLFIGLSQAQNQDLAGFLAELQNHPAIEANQALLKASQAQLNAVYFPVSGELSGGYNRLNVNTENATLPDDFDSSELANAFQFSATARFRPFVFGDISDLANQRQLDLIRTQLGYRETLASLEAQAIESAAQVQLAEMALSLSQEALDLSETILTITQTRFDKGAATETDIRNSQQSLFEAQNQVRSSELNLSLARQGLANLVGNAEFTNTPTLEPVQGVLPNIERAKLDLELARIGISNNQRGLFPVGQVSYTLPIVHEKIETDAAGNDIAEKAVNSELSFSLESRTLQPSVTYSYQNPKQTVAGFAAQPQLGLGLADLEGSLSIGISLSISPDSIAALQAANEQLNAAQANLRSLEDNATLTELSLQNALETNRLSLNFAKQSLANAELNQLNTAERVELGLATELDLAQSNLGVTQTKLSVLSAEFNYLQAVLNTYRSYAIPVSEVTQ